MIAVDARGYFTGGGVGRYTRNLVRELVSARTRTVDVRLLISNRHVPAELALPRSPGVEVIVSRAGWMDAAGERRWLEHEIADADLFHSLTGHWLPATTPSVATLLDLTPIVRPGLVSAEARRMSRRIADTVARASQVIAISQATASDAVDVLGTRLPPMMVVPLAAAPGFHPRVASAGLLQAYGLAKGEFILAVSAVNRHKNLARLVAAYAISAITTPLVIAGAQRDATAEVQDAIVRHGLTGRVRMIGRVTDQELAALYATCRAFVYPSLYEGFGLPVVEAMACGAPVIASRSSSIPEVTGDAAVLVDPSSTRSLAAALRRIDADSALRRDLKRRAVARAATFSWTRTAASTLAVYDSVLEGPLRLTLAAPMEAVA